MNIYTILLLIALVMINYLCIYLILRTEIRECCDDICCSIMICTKRITPNNDENDDDKTEPESDIETLDGNEETKEYIEINIE